MPASAGSRTRLVLCKGPEGYRKSPEKPVIPAGGNMFVPDLIEPQDQFPGLNARTQNRMLETAFQHPTCFWVSWLGVF